MNVDYYNAVPYVAGKFQGLWLSSPKHEKGPSLHIATCISTGASKKRAFQPLVTARHVRQLSLLLGLAVLSKAYGRSPPFRLNTVDDSVIHSMGKAHSTAVGELIKGLFPVDGDLNSDNTTSTNRETQGLG